ncbi:tRNA lysidine(34) synthetase TilS [Treponema sp.]|uniref:tRNA lysidine(34) synthetase TilS n=1 Tax=Treponema sp. TaxID=166 RepID=UPI0025FB4C01|nr:tRNA lysidine(34) synthetase TilS [Treponema sp.]MCR5219277.1 tRNA lysidine(34) synthetase TilS [Treponema sp.]
MSFVSDNFIKSVKKGLACCGVDLSRSLRIGAAVSGGADSISLLYSLSEIFKPEDIIVITVNHNIRPAEESGGDADYVEKCSSSLGIKCIREEVERGSIEALAQQRKMGLEEAARKVRYDIFEKYIEEEKIDYFCLAHNKNDAGETLLMRFLKGSGTEGLCSVPAVRGKYIRPLLNVTRDSIEGFLFDRGIAYRTDSTNSDSAMTRNFLRNEVIPLLEKRMAGWRNAVISASEKIRTDEDFLEQQSDRAKKEAGFTVRTVENNCSKDECEVFFDAGIYSSFHEALRMRILLNAIKAAGPDCLVSRDFIREGDKNICKGQDFISFAAGLSLSLKKGQVFVSRKNLLATERGFSVIIDGEGTFKAGDLSVNVCKSEKGLLLDCNGSSLLLEDMAFPFAFRSCQPSDKIRKADGSCKAVSRILDDFKAGELKYFIPVIQKLSCSKRDDFLEIKCIFGSPYGLKNWIIK